MAITEADKSTEKTVETTTAPAVDEPEKKTTTDNADKASTAPHDNAKVAAADMPLPSSPSKADAATDAAVEVEKTNDKKRESPTQQPEGHPDNAKKANINDDEDSPKDAAGAPTDNNANDANDKKDDKQVIVEHNADGGDDNKKKEEADAVATKGSKLADDDADGTKDESPAAAVVSMKEGNVAKSSSSTDAEPAKDESSKDESKENA